jgi:hypothetical protein
MLWWIGAIDPQELVFVMTVYLVYLVVPFVAERSRGLAAGLLSFAVAVAMICADVIVVRHSLVHRTFYREISAYFEPSLGKYDPREVTFKAPDFASLEFYTFRSGTYWETYHVHQDLPSFLTELEKGSLVFYVVEPTDSLYGGKVSSEKRDALRKYAFNVTPEVERFVGTRIPVMVFVPRSR